MTGERVRDRRKARGLSQEQLGALVGYSQNAVSSWEKETRDIPQEVLVPLAAALKTSVGYLLGETDDPSPLGRPAPSSEPAPSPVPPAAAGERPASQASVDALAQAVDEQKAAVSDLAAALTSLSEVPPPWATALVAAIQGLSDRLDRHLETDARDRSSSTHAPSVAGIVHGFERYEETHEPPPAAVEAPGLAAPRGGASGGALNGTNGRDDIGKTG